MKLFEYTVTRLMQFIRGTRNFFRRFISTSLIVCNVILDGRNGGKYRETVWLFSKSANLRGIFSALGILIRRVN